MCGLDWPKAFEPVSGQQTTIEGILQRKHGWCSTQAWGLQDER